MKAWHGIILAVIVGYALGYWFPMVGNSTLSKVYPRG